MACGCKTSKKAGVSVTEEQRKILEALSGTDGPWGCKDISEATGIPSKSVSCRLRSLKTKGLVESPVRCKYSITGAGLELVSG